MIMHLMNTIIFLQVYSQAQFITVEVRFLYYKLSAANMKELTAIIFPQVEACQGDLSTLANVVTSLANLGKSKDMSQSSTELSMIESLSNGDASLSELQQEEQASSDVTR